ncbi:hypothetical protein WJX74_005134 [Apatococcus lobatus]|uniref:Uncharacterized protein n=1 Tax=Apatococcus lobatus TaxID=904363 RepID=A0AAW1S6R8_9CHLO
MDALDIVNNTGGLSPAYPPLKQIWRPFAASGRPRQKGFKERRSRRAFAVQALVGKHAFPEPRRIWWHPAEGSLLLPDLTPADPGLKQSVVDSTIAFAKRLPLPEVGIRALAEVAINIALVVIVKSIIEKLAQQANKALDKSAPEQPSVLATMVATAIKAAKEPIEVLLPLNAFVGSLRVAVLALQIVADRQHPYLLNNRLLGHSLQQLMHVFVGVDHIFLSLSSLVIILFTCWFCLSWKESLLNIVSRIEHDLEEANRSTFSIERIAVPVSGLAGWGIVIVGALTSLHVVGINIQPLLTVGGVGGVAIGFGAQTVTANIVSGINLFLTRPFVVGDRIELKTAGGGSVLVGQVESIDPMRTVIDASGIPVAVPNKAILDMLICNESKLQRPAPPVVTTRTSRRYSTSVRLRYEDISKVPAICQDITGWLRQHSGVDQSMSMYAELASLREWSANMHIQVHITALQSRSYTAFNTEVLMKVAELVDQHGAMFARMA